MFAEILKQLRKSKGLTQVQFAKEFNISAGTIAMWETNKRVPDTTMLLKIADYFDVSVDYLLGNSNTPNNANPKDEELDETLVILNRDAKKLSPENRKKLLEMAKIMFQEDFNE